MKKRYAIWGVLFCSVCLMLASCEEIVGQQQRHSLFKIR